MSERGSERERSEEREGVKERGCERETERCPVYRQLEDGRWALDVFPFICCSSQDAAVASW